LLCTMPYAETQAACEVRHFRLHRSALAAQASSPERQKRRRIFHAVNIVQGLAIFVVVAVLTPMGHSEWIPASVMCVVGLHFLPRHGGRAV
jgi:hypothetical protein